MKSTTHQEFFTAYKAVHEPFVRYCSTRAFGIMDAEDLVQEAILAALQQFDKNTDQPYEQVAADCDRDHWLRSFEAKNYGLVDEVLGQEKE